MSASAACSTRGGATLTEPEPVAVTAAFGGGLRCVIETSTAPLTGGVAGGMAAGGALATGGTCAGGVRRQRQRSLATWER